MATVSTSSSSSQAQLLPSTSSVTITLSSESQPPIPSTNSAPAISNSLSTPATSSSSTPSEDCILPSTSDTVENLSTEIQPSVPLLDTSPTTSTSQPSISKGVNKNSKRRRNYMKEQKSDIEKKMSPHKPKNSYAHYTSENEDIIVDEDEHFNQILKFGFSHLITPTKYQKK
ncbi:hypothetical protein TNCV_3609461 [Trichonephila clavipes]|nr:hypothetical protein TNCV_3609461 [Trichonephila clavipes]